MVCQGKVRLFSEKHQLFGLWPATAILLFGKNVQGMRPLQIATPSAMGLPGLVCKGAFSHQGPCDATTHLQAVWEHAGG